ncbi:hypothetical protein MTO96_047113 [Rhipicephalus appendiculatus]
MRGALREKDKETKMKQGHISSPEPSGASTWVLPQRRRSPPVGFGDGSRGGCSQQQPTSIHAVRGGSSELCATYSGPTSDDRFSCSVGIRVSVVHNGCR